MIKNMVEADFTKTRDTPEGAPAWMPSWMPDASSLDYIVKLATATLVSIGILYLIGIRPRPVRAVVAARDAVL